MERRSDRSDSIRSETVVDPRTSLALWLRAGRAHRGMSVDDVAKVTKIQPRILERLEAGKLDGLPAEVFVRGFVRSFARCVGLDEREALRRYAACGGISALGTGDLTPTARALVEAMAELVPGSATAARATPRKMLAVDLEAEGAELGPALDAVAPIGAAAQATVAMDAVTAIEVVAAIEAVVAIAVPDPRAGFEAMPSTEPAVATPEPAPAEPAADEAPPPPSPIVFADVPPVPVSSAPAVVVASAAAAHVERAERERSKKKKRRAKRNKRGAGDSDRMSRERLASGTPAGASPVVPASEPGASATWAPRMPPIASTPSVPWRRSGLLASLASTPAASSPSIVPSLVIDDADPESAERVLEERAERHAPRRSFLPPILLDREDRTGRQGGLTLAVIILLIAATLTLSYLMRRPSASGDGMTRRPVAIDAAHG
jgi:hypothetical protein